MAGQSPAAFHDLLSLRLGVQTVTISDLAGQAFPRSCKVHQGRGSGFLRPRRALVPWPSLPHSFHKLASSKLPAVHPILALPMLAQHDSG